MSRRDLLIGLQHAAEQGRKMREGTEMAKMPLSEAKKKETKEKKESRLGPAAQAALRLTGRDNPRGTSSVDQRGQWNPQRGVRVVPATSPELGLG